MLQSQRIRTAVTAFAICGLLLGCAPPPVESLVATHTSASARVTFGQRQLEQMLDDRPDMKDAVPPSHPVRQWLVDGFDGKRVGTRVYWAADSPRTGRSAESMGPDSHGRCFIWLSGGTELSGIDKWAAVVFEMANLEEDRSTLHAEVLNGELDADRYAKKSVAFEYSALKKTEQYLHKHPLRQELRSGDGWYNWIMRGIPAFERYGAPFNTKNTNYDYFKRTHEK